MLRCGKGYQVVCRLVIIAFGIDDPYLVLVNRSVTRIECSKQFDWCGFRNVLSGNLIILQ